MWDAIGQNIRDAARGLRRTPGTAAAIVILLALGIGANATMFEIVDRLLLRPPDHVADADRLRMVYAQRPTLSLPQFARNLTYSDVADLKKLPALEAVAAFTPRRKMTMGMGADARKIQVQLAEASYFTTLGVHPLLGRFYRPAEDEPGAAPTAVVSAQFWRREFGGDARAIGRVIAIGKERYAIVGIAPDGFTGADLSPVDVWVPLRAAIAIESGREALVTRTWWWASAIIKLKPGVTDETANAQMTAAHVTARREVERLGGEPYLSRGPAYLYGTSIIAARRPNPSMTSSVSLCLAAVSTIVLIIACANVANLLLTRGIQTRRDLAVRAALGAPRARLAGLVIAEAAILAAAGAIMALIVARWSSAAARSFLSDIAFSETTTLNPRLLMFSAAAATLTVMLAGIMPALQAAGTSATEALRSVTRGSSARRSRTRNALMIGQTALSVVLLIGAGLFVRSFHGAAHANVGFEHGQVITATIEGQNGLSRERRGALYQEALERARAIPGVSRAALSIEATIAFGGWSGPGGIKAEGRDDIIDDLPDGGPFLYSGTEGFFETLGVKILRGREFTAADGVEGAEPVGMVSETFARTVWPARDPIGLRFTMNASYPPEPSDPPRPCRRVIGVFADFARVGIGDTGTIAVAVPPRPERHDAQALVVRTSSASNTGASDGPNGTANSSAKAPANAAADPIVVAALLRRALTDISPDIRFVEVRTMADRYDELLEPWRLGATMFAVFGVLALVVAIVGLYAILAFGVAQRRREIGIRSALGARGMDLIWLVMRQAGAFVVTGLLIGTALAAVAGRFIEGLLFNVRTSDPLVYAAVVVVLGAAALAASFGPAWRATSVSPSSALQAE